MAARGTYSVHGDAQTVSTAITVLELTAPSTASLELLKAWLSQSNILASTQARIRLLRKTGTITGTASPPSPVALGGDQAAGATAKWIATGEGTDGNVLIEDCFNYLNGWLWVPVPEERIIIPPSGIIALKFPAAPTSASWSFGLMWREIG